MKINFICYETPKYLERAWEEGSQAHNKEATYFMYGPYGNQECERIDPMHTYAQVDK